MNKLVICTTGTSIANACLAQREMLRQRKSWDEDAQPLKLQILDFLSKPENDLRHQDFRRKVCAEMNSLDRLGMERTDRVVLLASDTAQGRVCAEMIKKVIQESYSMSNAQVEVRRVEGLQVHNSAMLRERGLMNLVEILLDDYLTKDELRYSYDVILNATGGFKGTVPFLTILGMLYGARTVYTFEFSNELITLPPLPFTFDVEVYNRVRPALNYIEEEVAVREQAFLSKVLNYSSSEKDLFMAFTEPYENGRVTLSPLAYAFLKIDTRQIVLVSEQVLDTVRRSQGIHKVEFERLLSNVGLPLWRRIHMERWRLTDLLVIKQKRTGERIAGFVRAGVFHAALAFAEHEDYQRVLGNYRMTDFDNVNFVQWVPQEDLGIDEDYSDGIVEERDKLIVEKRELKERVERLNEDVIGLQLKTEGQRNAEEKLKALLKERDLELASLSQQVLSLQGAKQMLKQETLSLKDELGKDKASGKIDLKQLIRKLFKGHT